ncbi:MAG: hypothetical protein ABIO79_06690 [Ferruginibacter sp.]
MNKHEHKNGATHLSGVFILFCHIDEGDIYFFLFWSFVQYSASLAQFTPKAFGALLYGISILSEVEVWAFIARSEFALWRIQ